MALSPVGCSSEALAARGGWVSSCRRSERRVHGVFRGAAWKRHRARVSLCPIPTPPGPTACDSFAPKHRPARERVCAGITLPPISKLSFALGHAHLTLLLDITSPLQRVRAKTWHTAPPPTLSLHQLASRPPAGVAPHHQSGCCFFSPCAFRLAHVRSSPPPLLASPFVPLPWHWHPSKRVRAQLGNLAKSSLHPPRVRSRLSSTRASRAPIIQRIRPRSPHLLCFPSRLISPRRLLPKKRGLRQLTRNLLRTRAHPDSCATRQTATRIPSIRSRSTRRRTRTLRIRTRHRTAPTSPTDVHPPASLASSPAPASRQPASKQAPIRTLIQAQAPRSRPASLHPRKPLRGQ